MDEVSTAYLAKVKEAARIDESAFDNEVTSLILAARKELSTAGITETKANDEADPQILRAVFVYVRAEFGIENPDREKYLQSFESIKLRLVLSHEYNAEAGE